MTTKQNTTEQPLQKLLEVSLALTGTLHLETLLERIVEAAREVLQAEGASILLVSEATGRLHFEHVVVPDSMAHLIPQLKGMSLALGEGIAGHTVLRNEPMIIEDTSTDPRWAARVDATTGFLTRDLMCVPLAADGRVLGALEIVNKTPGPYTAADVPLVTAFAALAASALNNAQLHRRLERVHERLQELEATRSQYVATVSHELRTPITVIKGYVQVLEQFRSRLPDEKQGEFLRSIDRESDHLTNLLNDLFVVNEIKDLPRQCSFVPVNVEDLIRRFVGHWTTVNPGRTYMFKSVLDTPLTVSLDQKKIGHCLYHLLDNATKFSPAGSEVSIELRRFEDGAEVCVSDCGLGMRDEVVRRIYEPFWQADAGDTRAYGGLGLGLYIVSEIVKVHGGSVSCESQLGKGSHFHLRLPLCPPPPESIPAATDPAGSGATGG